MWPAFRNAAAATDEEARLRGGRREFCPQHIFPTVVNADKTARYFFLPPYFPRARCFSFICLSFFPSFILSLTHRQIALPGNNSPHRRVLPPTRHSSTTCVLAAVGVSDTALSLSAKTDTSADDESVCLCGIVVVLIN